MSLSAGARLGPYEIVAPLGAGGMGEVYRARDTKLGRDVALKLLPEAFANDKERLARFQREAQVLASLNHQNIAAIYGLEDSDNSSHALVMELVEGPTLADRIAQGPIPIDDALPIARQIAEALDAAHELGIIHRDLKPANIKLRPDGTVKVLDFGLAKMVETADGRRQTADGNDATYSPTISLASTRAGMILGTAAYMAPEQARGRVVDKRADVWAFGVVLYEMLTGRAAFAGDDISDILASVLKFDPDWTHLPPDTPPSIRKLLKRCLTKDPKLRLRECGSALADIHDALTSADRADSPTPSTDVKPAVSRRQWALIAAAAMMLGAVLGVMGWTTFRGGASDSPPPPTRRLTIALPEGDVLPNQGMLAISPDGHTLVYRARRGTADHMFRRPIDEFDPTIMPGADAALFPSFSPEGAWMGFIERSAGAPAIKKMPASGGPTQILATRPLASRGTTWTRDGRLVWVESGLSVMSVPANGGEATPLFKADGGLFYAQLLANNSLLVTNLPKGRVPIEGEIVAVRLGTGEKKTVQPDAWAGLVLPSGHLVFVRGSALWAVPFDSDRLEVVGSGVPVVQGVYVDPGGTAEFAVADDGTLAYVPSPVQIRERPLAFVGRDGGQFEALKAPARDYVSVALSPDQTRVAVQIGENEDADVWVAEIVRGTLTRITREPGFDGSPIWSRDGKNIVFASRRDGRWTLQSRPADGTGDTTLITTLDASATSAAPYGWSSDGLTLFSGASFGPSRSIGVTSMDGKSEWKPMRSAREMAVSPNGRWIAYASTDSGSQQVYLEGYPNPGERRIVSTSEGHSPRWSGNSGELFYLRGGPPDAVMRVTVASRRDGGVDIGTPEVFAPFNFFFLQGPSRRRGGDSYDVTPDGKRLLVIARSSGVEPAPSTRINVVVNWLDELKRLVPVGR